MSNYLAFKSHPVRRGTAGFTLIELLVAVTIIGILASIVLGALASARITARRAKTKATITKLHNIVMGKYEAYRTRRIPIDTSGLPPVTAAQLRLQALRQIMRWEMPERLSDVLVPSSSPIDLADINLALPVIAVRADTGTPVTIPIRRPSPAKSYFRQYLRNLPSGTYASAELLYLIVTTGDSDARAQFHDSEVGDADGDGWLEFHDAWGNPIQFLRWAPGFIGSDVQPNVAYFDTSNPPTAVMDPSTMASVATADHDPFDPFKVDMDPTSDPTDDSKPRGWRLVPLIYSAGPDGIYDIKSARLTAGGPDYIYLGSPYIVDPTASTQENSTIGAPDDSDNTSVTAPGNANLDHYDNIHNHRLGD